MIPFDFSWKNLLYGPGPQAIKFVLNATVNWLKTPDLVKKFGYKAHAFCPLCGFGQYTVQHIIVNCSFALKSGRYTWRHDSVLLLLKPILEDRIKQVNSSAPQKMLPQPLRLSFVKEGENKAAPQKPRRRCLLDGAADWKVLVDFDSDRIVFPPEICSTSSRPDIVIWSRQLKSVILIELTCPAEEGILRASPQARALLCLARTHSPTKLDCMPIDHRGRSEGLRRPHPPFMSHQTRFLLAVGEEHQQKSLRSRTTLFLCDLSCSRFPSLSFDSFHPCGVHHAHAVPP